MTSSALPSEKPFFRARGGAAFVFVAVTAILLLIGYAGVFSSFATYDDEGYLLVTLDGFQHGAHLYDDVYTSYGPTFYWLVHGALWLFRQPINHNVGRIFTLGAWVGSSLFCGLATWRLLKNVTLGVVTQVLVFRALSQLTSEPMHPGVLIAITLAAILLASVWLDGRPRAAMALIGAGCGILAMTKINVGIFAIAAVAFHLLGYQGFARGRRWLSHAVALGILAIPFGLMLPTLGHRWALAYACSTSFAALMAMAALHRSEPEGDTPLDLGLVFLGCLSLAVILPIVATLQQGTTSVGLVDGLLLRPSRHFTSVTGAEDFGLPSVIVAAVAVAVASVAVFRRLFGGVAPASRGLDASLRIIVGLGIMLTASGFFTSYPRGPRFAFLFAPLLWLAVSPPGADDAERTGGTSRVRRFLPLFAVLQTLQAFPVPGTQMRTGSFLFIPIGAICFADGLLAMRRALAAGSSRDWRRFELARRLGGAVLLLIPASTLLAYGARVTRAMKANPALSFPGADRLHLPSDQAPLYEAIVAKLKAKCSVFVMLPGMNSFYLWSGQVPPTWLNTTTWPFLFEPALQDRIVKRLRQTEVAGGTVCGLENPGLANGWAGGRPLPPGALVDYFSREMVPEETVGPYVLLAHRAAPTREAATGGNEAR